MSAYLRSLGWRLNRREIETMARQFAAAGRVAVRVPLLPDFCVPNVCANASALVAIPTCTAARLVALQDGCLLSELVA